MKTIVFLLILFVGCKNIEQHKNIDNKVSPECKFCLKVDNLGGSNFWVIKFRNYDDSDFVYIIKASDLSCRINGDYVKELPEYFLNSRQAVVFAKKFNTYEKCIKYNDSVHKKYLQLLQYRQEHSFGNHISSFKNKEEQITIYCE